MEYGDLTEKIIGCAFRVYGAMGFGFLESVYEKCLAIELSKEGLTIETQKPILVFYCDQVVGEFRVDLMVAGTVLVELKSVRTLTQAHGVQLVNYLSATKQNVGLLINFGQSRVEVKRKLRTLSSKKA